MGDDEVGGRDGAAMRHRHHVITMSLGAEHGCGCEGGSLNKVYRVKYH